jgi:hypothetical protein
MGIWGKTTPGIFDNNSFFQFMDFSIAGSMVSRAMLDIFLISTTALILFWILLDHSLLAFFSSIIESCKK